MVPFALYPSFQAPSLLLMFTVPLSESIARYIVVTHKTLSHCLHLRDVQLLSVALGTRGPLLKSVDL